VNYYVLERSLQTGRRGKMEKGGVSFFTFLSKKAKKEDQLLPNLHERGKEEGGNQEEVVTESIFTKPGEKEAKDLLTILFRKGEGRKKRELVNPFSITPWGENS